MDLPVLEQQNISTNQTWQNHAKAMFEVACIELKRVQSMQNPTEPVGYRAATLKGNEKEETQKNIEHDASGSCSVPNAASVPNANRCSLQCNHQLVKVSHTEPAKHLLVC